MAVERKVIGGTRQTSPAFSFSICTANCRAAVPLLQAMAPDAPIFKAKAASNASVRGPEAKSGARTASATADTSSSSMVCRP